jgi:hypothetical protein
MKLFFNVRGRQIHKENVLDIQDKIQQAAAEAAAEAAAKQQHKQKQK